MFIPLIFSHFQLAPIRGRHHQTVPSCRAALPGHYHGRKRPDDQADSSRWMQEEKEGTYCYCALFTVYALANYL